MRAIRSISVTTALNRLTNYAVGTSCTAAGSGDTAKTVGYDALGDITSKSDVGTYSYPASGSSSVQPHAVSGITGTVNGVVNPTFTYDADGNMTAGDGRTMTWTSFNMAATVTEGTTSSAFVYDGNQARLQQCVPNCTSPTTTTTYFNESLTGSMEERVVSGSTTTWHDYIKTDTGIVAELFTTSGTTTPYYFNGDHLGSTSVLTNASGAVTERDSYDAWGKRRNPNGTDNTACSITSTSLRGYTGQEMMDPVCLINLNARLYDPTVARVMSADPIVSDPMGAQGLNRYSYVENAPMSFTDPTGYCAPLAYSPDICWGPGGPFGPYGSLNPLNSEGVDVSGSCTFDCTASVSPFGGPVNGAGGGYVQLGTMFSSDPDDNGTGVATVTNICDCLWIPDIDNPPQINASLDGTGGGFGSQSQQSQTQSQTQNQTLPVPMQCNAAEVELGNEIERFSASEGQVSLDLEVGGAAATLAGAPFLPEDSPYEATTATAAFLGGVGILVGNVAQLAGGYVQSAGGAPNRNVEYGSMNLGVALAVSGAGKWAASGSGSASARAFSRYMSSWNLQFGAGLDAALSFLTQSGPQTASSP
jgi:RHS repeat-associated protein